MVIEARPTPAGQVLPMTLQTQEIRLATTMTGGVSLAIWMGGVAREIDLLTQASNLRRLPATADPLTLDAADELRFYSDLINLLDVSVDVDVLSGTSAGGINAALLAYARTAEKSLAKVRDLWLRIGSIVTLLRNPTDADVPSLLQGDAQMLTSLQQQIPRLDSVTHPTGKGPKLSTTLFITTTLLSGETSRFTDSYGTLVQDVDHRGLFRFDQRGLLDTDALALAARSTAAFPAAFEPSFLPCAEPVTAPVGGVLARPAVGEYSNITRSHWAADGGLLNNQPIDAVLQKVFERPARRLVRRVLLYVVPTAGSAPDPLKLKPAADPSKPLGLLGGLLADIGAVKNQSIASDLRAIREHNDRIGARIDLRLRLAQLGSRLQPPAESSLLAGGLFEDYLARQSQVLGLAVISELMRLMTSWPLETAGGSARSVPAHWADALRPGGTSEDDCKQAVADLVRSRWAQAPTDFAGLATFDESAYYGAKAIALSLLRCAFTIAQYDDSAATQGWEAELRDELDAVHTAYQPDPKPAALAELVRPMLENSAAIRAKSMPDAVAAITASYLDQVDRPQLEAGWQALAAAVGRVLVAIKLPTQTPGPDAQPGSRASTLAAAMENVSIYQAYFATAGSDRERALRMFALHAAHRAMLPIGAEVDQPVELIQLSADSRTLLDLQRQTARSKLTGMQLHHFGAFYKQSWRANDWMWGRLDGAGWLIHLLLDPRRINTVAEADEHGSRAGGFLQRLQRIGVPLPPSEETLLISEPEAPAQYLTQAAVSLELAYLDDPQLKVPSSLPLLALWVAQTWQRGLLVEELPTLAGTILHPDTGSGVSERSSAAAERWAAQVPSIAEPGRLREQAGPLLTGCPVPDETLRGQAGTPLMVHTVSKAAAVVSAAINSVQQVPGTVRPATSAIRTVALTGYRVTTMVKSLPRRVIGAGSLMLLVGAMLTVQQSTLFGLAGLLVAACGGYLVVFGAWQTSRILLSAVVSSTLVGAAASLTVPAVRRGLFGSAAKPGWLADRLVWLGNTWWHPLAGLGGVLLLLALVGLVFARIGDGPSLSAGRLPVKVAVALATAISLATVGVLAFAVATKG